jgi:hypothetical protein
MQLIFFPDIGTDCLENFFPDIGTDFSENFLYHFFIRNVNLKIRSDVG